MTHEARLWETWLKLETKKTFQSWLIEESERMSGDLGKAYAKIGELQGQNNIMKAKIKDLNKANK